MFVVVAVMSTSTLSLLLPTPIIRLTRRGFAVAVKKRRMPLPKESICLVTGASGTIGLAIAKALVEEGCARKVFLTGRSLEKLQVAAAKIREPPPSARGSDDHGGDGGGGGGVVRCLPCDVTNEKSVEGLFRAIDQETNGKITLLVNNAGINAPPGATVDLPADVFRSVMDTNVLGPLLCARESIKRMKHNGCGGRIINIGSLSASRPRYDSAAYTTSKFALRGLTQSLALDCRRHNIAVSVIHPGNVDSDLLTPDDKAGRLDEGFLPARHVAQAVLNMAHMPYETNVLEVTIMPTTQPFVGRG